MCRSELPFQAFYPPYALSGADNVTYVVFAKQIRVGLCKLSLFFFESWRLEGCKYYALNLSACLFYFDLLSGKLWHYKFQ